MTAESLAISARSEPVTNNAGNSGHRGAAIATSIEERRKTRRLVTHSRCEAREIDDESSVNLVRRAFPPTLNFWPRTHRFERDAISLAFFVGDAYRREECPVRPGAPAASPIGCQPL